MGRGADLRPAPGTQPGRTSLELLRRPEDGQHDRRARRPPSLGPHVQGSVPALQGDAGFRPALPERVRLSGAVGRGQGRAGARPQLEAGDRGVRDRQVRASLPRAGRRVGARHHASVDPARPVDGLGERLLHLQRHEHRVHLAVPEDTARARRAVPGTPLDRVVPALRHVDLATRAVAVRRLPRQVGSVALRPLPSEGT